MNRLAYLLAGIVVGAAGMAVAKKIQDGEMECSIKGVVQGGHDVVEKVLGVAETLKEDVEDFIAESKYHHEEKLRTQANASSAEEGASTDGVQEIQSDAKADKV